MKKRKWKNTFARRQLRGLRLEPLEDRRLLAADAFATPFALGNTNIESVIQRAATTDFVPGELLVAVKSDIIDPNVYTALERPWHDYASLPVEATMKTLIESSPEPYKSQQLVHLKFGEETDVVATMRDLQASRSVLWSQPNFLYEGDDPREFTPNDPQYPSQYHHTLIGNDIAWEVSLGAPNIVIAVTDDGVDIDHEDLASSIWVNPGEVENDGIDNDGNGYVDDIHGYNFLNNNNNVDAQSGDIHGTHVAGVAAGITDNNLGTAGVASGTTIMPLKWYVNGGDWTSAMIVEAFTYAADNGADIVNTSYNMDFWASDASVYAAFDYLYDAGVLHFNSAGNGNKLNPPRQIFEQSILVANTNNGDVRHIVSNYGTGIDLAAPGTAILAPIPGNGYGQLTGTSHASPNAAGVAALIWSAHPTWTREQVVTQLFATSDDISTQNQEFIGLLGNGRINSGRALTETLAAPQVIEIGNFSNLGTAKSTDAIQDFYITFDQFMDQASVTDAASYELLEAGADGEFDTEDDHVIPLLIDSEYRVGTNGINISAANGPLGLGYYRFQLLATGITNPFYGTLDGDGDGFSGGDYEAFLTVELEAFEHTGPAASFSTV